MSFGDSEWAEITNPPLTTMRHPLFEMGQMAAQRLLMRLQLTRRQLVMQQYRHLNQPLHLMIQAQ